ncbi:MAG: hypothetical protein U0271_34150 [Polyangiaceae bacterium]
MSARVDNLDHIVTLLEESVVALGHVVTHARAALHWRLNDESLEARDARDSLRRIEQRYLEALEGISNAHGMLSAALERRDDEQREARRRDDEASRG